MKYKFLSSKALITSYKQNMQINAFELLYKKFKLYIDNIDNNENDLINLIKENISNYWFVDFIKYYFEKNEVYMCDALICTWLESDLPIKSNAFRLALELAKKSNIKSLVAKANDILDFYF